MRLNRRAARTDNDQQSIVDALKAIPHVSIALNHDDIFVGYQGNNFWFELKSKNQISKTTGKPYKGRVKKSQEKLLDTWTGQYNIVSSIEEILDIMCIPRGES